MLYAVSDVARFSTAKQNAARLFHAWHSLKGIRPCLAFGSSFVAIVINNRGMINRPIHDKKSRHHNAYANYDKEHLLSPA